MTHWSPTPGGVLVRRGKPTSRAAGNRHHSACRLTVLERIDTVTT